MAVIFKRYSKIIEILMYLTVKFTFNFLHVLFTFITVFYFQKGYLRLYLKENVTFYKINIHHRRNQYLKIHTDFGASISCCRHSCCKHDYCYFSSYPVNL